MLNVCAHGECFQKISLNNDSGRTGTLFSAHAGGKMPEEALTAVDETYIPADLTTLFKSIPSGGTKWYAKA